MTPELRNPSAVGARAELEVATALARAGWSVFVPYFAPQSRADLVVVRSGRAERVQCKSGRLRPSGVIAFRTCSNTANVPRDYRDEIDLFGVCTPELRRVFLVPVEEVGTRLCHLRLSLPSSGQRRGIRMAADYEVPAP